MTDFLASAPDNIFATARTASLVTPFKMPQMSGGDSSATFSNYIQKREQWGAMRGQAMPRGGGAIRLGGGNGRGVPGPMLGGYGFDPSGMNPDAMNQALSPYGVQLPTHINPFLMFNDQKADGSPSWAANHPRIARGIEGALMGAQVPQGATTGENIANIARTIMGIPAAYRANRQAQFQASFDTARQMADIQKMTDEHLKNEAQIRRDDAMAKYYGRPQKQYNGADIWEDEKGGHFVLDEMSGEMTGTGGTTGNPQGKLNRVGTPKTGNGRKQFGPYQFSAIEERLAAEQAEQDGWDFNNGMPPNWAAKVKAQAAGLAGSRGAGGTSGKLGTEYGMGDLSKAEQDKLNSIDKDADEQIRQLRSQRLPGIDEISKDPNAIMNWDKTRESKIKQIQADRDKAKEDFYKNRPGTGNLPKPKASAANPARRRPEVHINPDGTISVK